MGAVRGRGDPEGARPGVAHVKLESGFAMAESGPELDQVFIRFEVPRPWWWLRIFGRERVVTVLLDPGRARTLAASLHQAVHRLEIKRQRARAGP